MTQTKQLTHDGSLDAFDGRNGIDLADVPVVHVEAPADFEGAFDTDRFYKIEDATVARPIKQPYIREDSVVWYKKPAEELQKAAWTFDNAPFTIGHPDTGMVKSVDDVHGFWRNPRYDEESDRLKEDLFLPVNDDEAAEWVEHNSDVSIGYYDAVHSDYDGNTGDISDDDVDGFQVDLFGNHIAGVERGRCSSASGCGLGIESDHQDHGEVIMTVEADQTTSFEIEATNDAPSGIYVADDGTWLAVAPSEHPDDTTEHPDDGKFPVDNCSDVDDAWGLRGHTDSVDISKSTLGNRIQRAAEAMDCDVPGEDGSTDSATQTNTDSNMTDGTDDNTGGDFDVPDLSIDALADKNDAVDELIEERDSFREDVAKLEDNIEETRDEIQAAFDEADNFSVEMEDDDCVCDAVEQLVEDLDAKAAEVADLEDELSGYREDERAERLDDLVDLGANRDEWDEASLDELDEEVQRRKEVAEDLGVSAKEIETDSGPEETDTTERGTTISGQKKLPRGYGA